MSSDLRFKPDTRSSTNTSRKFFPEAEEFSSTQQTLLKTRGLHSWKRERTCACWPWRRSGEEFSSLFKALHRGRGSYSQGDRVVKPENVAVLVMSRVPSPSLENTGEGWLVLIYWPVHIHTGIWSLRWKASECQSDQARVNGGVTMTEWTEDPVTLLCRWYDSIVWYFCRLTKYVCGHSG